MDTYAVPQDSSGLRGVHLTWCGPGAWVYAPGGFTVQRRPSRERAARDCEGFEAATIDELRRVRELRLHFGVITLRDGGWLADVADVIPENEAGHTPTEIFRVDFDADHRIVEVNVRAKLSFAVALHDGRVVGTSGPDSGPAAHRILAPRLDAAVVYTLDPTSLRVCVDFTGDPTGGRSDDWHDVAPIVSGLTLPFREVMPDLHTDAEEFAEAKRRLLPGEDIGSEEFARLAAVIRPLLAAAKVRPSEFTLLVREDPAADADEARALDPLRLMLVHPTWRRALGFGLFDDDPALVVGDTYEYRVSATYPAPDVIDVNHGFATVPSGTLLPGGFALGGPHVRVPKPVAVAITPGTPDGGLVRITRRGVQLDPTRESFWLGPGLDDWSLVVDFPTPVDAVVLELASGHDLVFSAGDAIGPFADIDAVPQGETVRIDFAIPAEQFRLRGKGFLHALRVPSVAAGDKAELAAVTPPITLVDTPLPTEPVTASATSLQQPIPPPTSLVPAAEVAHRDALGFTVTWRPAPAFGVTAWLPDFDAAVPLDATVFQLERRIEPSGDWEPVLDDDNQTLGDRGGAVPALSLAPGVDLATVFPDNGVSTTGADLDLHFVDSFDAVDAPAGGDIERVPGSIHRYRVRTIDSVGRPSTGWRETAPVRLEKHVPPPVPVQVSARVLVPDAPDLTADEQALLGTSDSAVVLRWEWGADQREQDPFATEFRVYATPPMDSVVGSVTAVTQLSSGQVTTYRVDLQLGLAVAADILAGQRLDAGHPFFIRSHDAGSTIQMVVETRLRPGGVAPVPLIGPVTLALPLSPDRTRPPAWGARRAVVPIDADPTTTTYDVVLRDLAAVTDGASLAMSWVGVSAADDQEYVPDQLAPLDDRPGNESAIVPVQATARYHGRPELDIPPPLAPVPRVRTPEPGAEPVHFLLDLTPHLPAEALAVGRVRTERVAVAAVLGACRLTADDRILAVPVVPAGGGDDSTAGEPEVEIAIPNPDDRAELAAQIRSGRTEVEDRFAVYLAGHHAYRDRLFAPVADALQTPGPFAETLPPSTGRYVYRVRAADQAGHVSAGAATAAVVVRVPSLRQGTPPLKLPSLPDDTPATLRVQVAADAELTHLVVFTSPIVGTGAVTTGEIMRVPNRPDLLPAGGLFLRSPDGTMLTPTAIDLDPPDVGDRVVLVPVAGGPGDRTRVWLATLTADGVPSPVAGPYSLVHPVAVPS